MRPSAALTAACTLALLLGAASADARQARKVGRGASLHQGLLMLDTHLDTPASLALPGWSIMAAHDVKTDYTQVDLPRMKRGGLDGGFWAIYTPQGPLDAVSTRKARDYALMRASAIREMVAAHPESFALADRAADAARIKAQGRRVVYLSIENAWPLGDDPTLLQAFHAMGVRMAGFAHFRANQFADSSTDAEKWGGLSPAGIQLLAEMNRLGVVPDLSHSSDKALDEALRLSKSPIILSHSGCRAVFDHPRNIDDSHLRALAAKGGVIQINSVYVKAHARNPEREAATKALEEKYPEDRRLTLAEYAAMLAEKRAIDRRFPERDRATFDDVMANLLHAIKVAGVDHVGIGLDWDGGGGVAGLEDVADLPRITAALLKAGYSRADVQKIWSGNVLRVLAAAEAAAGKS
ncbi:dipeptidase [Novosphingobium cyanobacteriorum]|uniref:Dipeptidase n=1 Tax=Novosphingobium cyanobacteriorum TaxID=3024215 RepID=A0ABT6CJ58_9SPHN|nr:dipeptidase [Novosphingobium cyanobacteriorum]MDF8333841.1 dipeptidase [Novosphingobium cyanobacteriorum]